MTQNKKLIGSETRDIFMIFSGEDAQSKAEMWKDLTVQALEGEGFSITQHQDHNGFHEAIEEISNSDGSIEVTIQVEKSIYADSE